MSTPRLMFLYPVLFRTSATAAVRDSTARVAASSSRCRRSANPPHSTAFFTTSTGSHRAAFQRHGKAVEPPPASADTQDPSQSTQAGDETLSNARASKQSVQDGDKAMREALSESSNTSPEASADGGPTSSVAAAAAAGKTPHQAATDAKMKESGPMEAVLHMPPPSTTSHIHIPSSPYVHNFDTYTLVKHLEGGGYSKDQSITVMKAVRKLLAHNLDVAQGGLVSKSDVDNETYLFNAACSELSTEVKNNRRTADEQMRQQRTHLAHEVDIVGQRMTQDIQTLKDDVRAAFHDRKMSVREEQRVMESLIQGVNMKISVRLNGEAKSDIEGLRWVLIRSSVLGILFMAVMTLATLRYGSYINHEKKRVAEEKQRRAEELKRNGGREDHAHSLDAAQILAAN